MTKLQFFLAMTFIAIFSNVQAQITREEARDLILNLLNNDLDRIDVFLSNEIYYDTSKIVLYDNSLIDLPYNSNWVIFVDDNPFANWHHSARFYFVDVQTGNYISSQKSIYPAYLSQDFEPISRMPRPTPNQISPSSNITSQPAAPVNSHLYAVIIIGAGEIRFWNDLSLIFCTLTKTYGYPKDHIIIHYKNGTSGWGYDLDGDGLPETFHPSFLAEIQKTFNGLSGIAPTQGIPILQNNDQLFVFTSGHGETNGTNSYIKLAQIPPPPIQPVLDLYDYDLAALIAPISCAQIIIGMQQCYSGGFKDDIMDYSNYNVQCKNRNIYTATSHDFPSYAEIWLTSSFYPNIQEFIYTEFTFYWTAASRGYFPQFPQPWNPGQPLFPFPYSNVLPNHPSYQPDINGDGIVELGEAFQFANDYDTWSPYGYYYQNPYPFTGPEYPQNEFDNGFQNDSDILSLFGYGGTLNNDEIVTGNRHYLIGTNLTVNNSLLLDNNTNIHLDFSNVSIEVSPSGNLGIANNVTFTGNTTNTIQVNGNINIWPPAPGGIHGPSFMNNSNTGYLDGLYINKNDLQITIDDATFNQARLHNYGQSLTVQNSHCLNNTVLFSNNGNLHINNNIFDQSGIALTNDDGDNSLLAEVIGNQFSCPSNLSSNMAAIDVWLYGKYDIHNNTISKYYNGIQLSYCGESGAAQQTIANNIIENCFVGGLYTYSSYAKIQNNHIRNNRYGVRFFNNSDIELTGNREAQYCNQTQEINDNSSYELYATNLSFPRTCTYNSIRDDDNGGNSANPHDPIVYWDNDYQNNVFKDVTLNCWGNAFYPPDDLYSNYGGFHYQPYWCPGIVSPPPDPVEDLFNSGITQFVQGNYSQAKSIFQELIETYPDSEYAQAAMKELYRLEQFASNDYSGLQDYYRTNDSIVHDTVLLNLGEFLANWCNTRLNQWPAAITWYENRILNPPSYTDSVLAVIDLEFIYTQMPSQGNRPVFVGALPQYIPENKEQFHKDRDYLISLLPGRTKNVSSVDDSEFTHGKILQNSPNPVSNETTLNYRLSEDGMIAFELSDVLGNLVLSIDVGFQMKGEQSSSINVNSLPDGMYLVSLKINGGISDTRKIIVRH